MLFLQQQEKRPRSNQSFFREQFFFTHLAPYWQISYECTVFFVDGAGFFYREKKQKFVCRYVCACIKLVYCVCVCACEKANPSSPGRKKFSPLFFRKCVQAHKNKSYQTCTRITNVYKKIMLFFVCFCTQKLPRLFVFVPKDTNRDKKHTFFVVVCFVC